MRLLSAFFTLILLLVVAGTVIGIGLFNHYSKDLPDYTYLKDYRPPTLTRIYADDGRMMATIAEEQRVFVPIKAIPKRVATRLSPPRTKIFISIAASIIPA